MTYASITLFRRPGREPTAVNPRMLAKANYLIVPRPRDAAAPSVGLLPAKDMVARLRGGGLPVAYLADILGVERKTVYAWLDGADPRDANASRIETLYRLLGDGRLDLRSLHRVWNRRLEHGLTVRELLAAKDISVPAVQDALEMLSSALTWHSARDVRREAPKDGWDIPVVDELPTAGARD